MLSAFRRWFGRRCVVRIECDFCDAYVETDSVRTLLYVAAELGYKTFLADDSPEPYVVCSECSERMQASSEAA